MCNYKKAQEGLSSWASKIPNKLLAISSWFIAFSFTFAFTFARATAFTFAIAFAFAVVFAFAASFSSFFGIGFFASSIIGSVSA
jgi:hypothetical protein